MDVKRVVAYSTMVHVGLMLVGLGLVGIDARGFGSSDITDTGMEHLFVHGWSKGLLFMVVGVVLHSVIVQDMRGTGGMVASNGILGIGLVATWSVAGIGGSMIGISKECVLGTLVMEFGWIGSVIALLVVGSIGYSIGITMSIVGLGNNAWTTGGGLSLGVWSLLAYLGVLVVVLPLGAGYSVGMGRESNLELLELLWSNVGTGAISKIDWLTAIFVLSVLLSMYVGRCNGRILGFHLVSDSIRALHWNRWHFDRLVNSLALWLHAKVLTRVVIDVEYGWGLNTWFSGWFALRLKSLSCSLNLRPSVSVWYVSNVSSTAYAHGGLVLKDIGVTSEVVLTKVLGLVSASRSWYNMVVGNCGSNVLVLGIVEGVKVTKGTEMVKGANVTGSGSEGLSGSVSRGVMFSAFGLLNNVDIVSVLGIDSRSVKLESSVNSFGHYNITGSVTALRSLVRYAVSVESVKYNVNVISLGKRVTCFLVNVINSVYCTRSARCFSLLVLAANCSTLVSAPSVLAASLGFCSSCLTCPVSLTGLTAVDGANGLTRLFGVNVKIHGPCFLNVAALPSCYRLAVTCGVRLSCINDIAGINCINGIAVISNVVVINVSNCLSSDLQGILVAVLPLGACRYEPRLAARYGSGLGSGSAWYQCSSLMVVTPRGIVGVRVMTVVYALVTIFDLVGMKFNACLSVINGAVMSVTIKVAVGEVTSSVSALMLRSDSDLPCAMDSHGVNVSVNVAGIGSVLGSYLRVLNNVSVINRSVTVKVINLGMLGSVVGISESVSRGVLMSVSIIEGANSSVNGSVSYNVGRSANRGAAVFLESVSRSVSGSVSDNLGVKVIDAVKGIMNSGNVLKSGSVSRMSGMISVLLGIG